MTDSIDDLVRDLNESEMRVREQAAAVELLRDRGEPTAAAEAELHTYEHMLEALRARLAKSPLMRHSL